MSLWESPVLVKRDTVSIIDCVESGIITTLVSISVLLDLLAKEGVQFQMHDWGQEPLPFVTPSHPSIRFERREGP